MKARNGDRPSGVDVPDTDSVIERTSDELRPGRVETQSYNLSRVSLSTNKYISKSLLLSSLIRLSRHCYPRPVRLAAWLSG